VEYGWSMIGVGWSTSGVETPGVSPFPPCLLYKLKRIREMCLPPKNIIHELPIELENTSASRAHDVG